MGNFKAGAGTGIIRFSEELFPFQGFKGVHDDPHVRILYIEKKEKWVIASYEIVMLSDSLIGKCRELIAEALNMKVENVWLHMTHAITTPHPPGGPGVDPNAEEIRRERELFEQALLQATREAAEQTADSIKEALIGVGRGESYTNCSRDIQSDIGWWIGINPEGFSMRDMTVLKVMDTAQNPIAFLISYDIKPCAVDNSQMKENERLISSDVPGRACTLMEEKYGVPVLFCMAASGDQIPRKTAMYDEIVDGQVRTVDLGVVAGFTIVEELGREMAEDAIAIADGIEKMIEAPDIRLQTGSFQHGTKPRMELMPRKAVIFEADGTTDVTVSTAEIGNIAFVGCKPEINCITEKELRDRSLKEYTMVVSLLNGGMKYMPDQSSYDHASNEAQASMLMPGAAEKFVDIAVNLLKE
ncbi:MAG: hypothetical protein HDR17_03425 [Lachnospiraceae bacterium]|nr:hypothetical protein [Lachnospiraceae bacterium]